MELQIPLDGLGLATKNEDGSWTCRGCATVLRGPGLHWCEGLTEIMKARDPQRHA